MLHALRPIQLLWQTVGAERGAAQIAWGIALGALVGLVPKGNLTAWLLGLLLLATRVNLGAGLLTALVVSSLSPFTDVLAHGIGLRMLSVHGVRTCLGMAYDWPLVPWLALNNTVVLGSTMLGLVLVFPLQHVARGMITFLSSEFKQANDAAATEDVITGENLGLEHLAALGPEPGRSDP